MPSNKKGKQAADRQPSVEEVEEDGQSSGSGNGEGSGELVPRNSGNAGTTGQTVTLIPGFSQEQVAGLMTMIGAVVDARLEQRLGNFNTNRQQNTPFPSIEASKQHPEPSPPEDTATTANTSLRAEEVGYFDPEFQQEHGNTHGPVVNAGKYVYYRDVYIFVDRLKDLANRKPPDQVKDVITECMRGSALIWYSTELTELERDLLRSSAADLDRWYTTLINKFKVRTAVALSQLSSQTYSFSDMRHTSPRAFIQRMLHLAKAAHMDSTYNRLTTVWNQFAVNLRRDIPEPQPSTTIGQFIDQVDSKTAIWMEYAQRQQQRPWQNGSIPRDSAPSNQPNGQKHAPSQQQQQPYRGKYPPRLAINDGKGHAYLAEVTPDGYGVYEEEYEEDENGQGS